MLSGIKCTYDQKTISNTPATKEEMGQPPSFQEERRRTRAPGATEMSCCWGGARGAEPLVEADSSAEGRLRPKSFSATVKSTYMLILIFKNEAEDISLGFGSGDSWGL
jgi:hypothetical protein